MKVTILGCGTSGGVPLVGCDCSICKSDNPRNKRLRVSVLIEKGKDSILIDTSPDLRQQALRYNIRKVDAVLYTHAHADHLLGIDELKSFNFLGDKTIDIYADKKTLGDIKTSFSYCFQPPIKEYGWFRPALIGNEIPVPGKFTVGDIEVQSFNQIHGKGYSTGFRVGNFAYSTDVNVMPEESLETLKGVETWVVDCLRYKKAPTHSHLELTLSWIDKVKPKLAILTHMNHEVNYDEMKNQLPEGVVPAYDGMILEI